MLPFCFYSERDVLIFSFCRHNVKTYATFQVKRSNHKQKGPPSGGCMNKNWGWTLNMIICFVFGFLTLLCFVSDPQTIPKNNHSVCAKLTFYYNPKIKISEKVLLRLYPLQV